MNVKKISYILLAISFVMIISGGVSSFLMGLRTDKQMINKIFFLIPCNKMTR